MNEIKKLLINMQDDIVNSLNQEKAKSQTIKTNDIGDEADYAIEERAQELHRLFSQREQAKLRMIQNALERISLGEYGYCEECGEEIELKRLKAVPFARFCFECQSNEETISKSRDNVSENEYDYFKDTGGSDDDKDS